MARIADHIAREMRAANLNSVCWGDNCLVDWTRDKLRLGNPHPLNCMTAACNAMERAPDLFEKRYIRATDCKGRARVVRGFKLHPTTHERKER